MLLHAAFPLTETDKASFCPFPPPQLGAEAHK